MRAAVLSLALVLAGGSAIAAASVTMPRMPAHEMTRPLPIVGRSIGRGG